MAIKRRFNNFFVTYMSLIFEQERIYLVHKRWFWESKHVPNSLLPMSYDVFIVWYSAVICFDAHGLQCCLSEATVFVKEL